MRISSLFVLVVSMGVTVAARAQTPLTYSGCYAPPEVQAAYDTTLSQDSLVKLKIKERNELLQKTYDDLLAKYPRDYSLLLRQYSLAQDKINSDQTLSPEASKAALDAERERWVKNAKEHPDDALALLMAGRVLLDKDKPEAIRLMESAKAKAPDFPWPAHELIMPYAWGEQKDDTKMKENLERFYTLCPAWIGPNLTEDTFWLTRNADIAAKTVAPLRARLEKETEPKRLEAYQVLWQREFLTRPVTEYDAEREQVKKDLKRLEALVPNGDAVWRDFLIQGYTMSGASNEELARMEDAANHDFPHAEPTFNRLWKQFDKEHPRPDGQRDTEAWKAYHAAQIEMIKKALKEFPDVASVQRGMLLMMASNDPYISREDGLAALDGYLETNEEYGRYGLPYWFDANDPPSFLLDHGWEPGFALDLLKKTSTYKDGGHKGDWGDSVTLGLILKAAALAHKPEEAQRFRSVIEGSPPEDKGHLEQYWTNRARFAVLDNRPQDALIYYRRALDSRTQEPEYQMGVLRDDLMTEFHDLWRAQGGTEDAWSAWNPPATEEKAEAKTGDPAPSKDGNLAAKDKPAAGKEKTATPKRGDWKEVTEKMPDFEFTDFSGKLWRQKDLHGKAVIITSWATWCGPCRMQDKLLQKFYEKVKDRKDLVVLTFNVDQNPGLVAPFMRKEGYTFPALAASSFKSDFVPRTWVIDTQGKWRWVRNGSFGKSYAEFEKGLLDQIAQAEVKQ